MATGLGLKMLLSVTTTLRQEPSFILRAFMVQLTFLSGRQCELSHESQRPTTSNLLCEKLLHGAGTTLLPRVLLHLCCYGRSYLAVLCKAC